MKKLISTVLCMLLLVSATSLSYALENEDVTAEPIYSDFFVEAFTAVFEDEEGIYSVISTDGENITETF